MKYIILILVILFASCTSTNKHKTIEKQKTDSVSVVKVDSASLKRKAAVATRRKNTVTKKKLNKTTETVTVYEFDTSKAHVTGIEYFEGNPVVGKLIKVTKKQKVVDKSNIIKKENLTDSISNVDTQSVSLHKEIATDVKKESFVKNKEVKRVNYTGIVLGISLLLLLILLYKYRKRLPYIGRLFS